MLDALDELERAERAGVRRTLVRVTAGIEADTHEAIRTGQRGSKFGLPPDQALDAIDRARPAGLHVHIGSQLTDSEAALATVDWLAAFSADCRARLGWTPQVLDLGGGLAVRTSPDDPPVPTIAEHVRALLDRVEQAWARHELPRPSLILEPGRSLVGPAGVTLYRVGVVKRASADLTYVAVDGGMSDNPRPALYGARYSALLANRADERAGGHLPRRGQALRVGRRADRRRRAARAAPRRPARGPGDRRVHARDGVQLQRRPEARRGARARWRGARGSAPGNRGRPARMGDVARSVAIWSDFI